MEEGGVSDRGRTGRKKSPITNPPITKRSVRKNGLVPASGGMDRERGCLNEGIGNGRQPLCFSTHSD
jgi:hypothetical protein